MKEILYYGDQMFKSSSYLLKQNNKPILRDILEAWYFFIDNFNFKGGGYS